jgi:hypothetical protein
MATLFHTPQLCDQWPSQCREVLSLAEEDADMEIGPDLPIDPCCTSF